MKPVVVIGAGGHSKVLINSLLQAGPKILGIVDSNPEKRGMKILGIEVVATDVDSFDADEVLLVNGIGTISTSTVKLRREIFERYKKQGYSFANVIHPNAVIAREVTLGEGVQIMAGVVVQPGTSVGNNSIINTRAAVDHDCKIGAHCHLAPGVTLSGGVKLGDEVHIGTGASLIQSVEVGANTIVGAGALVLKAVPQKSLVLGVPGKVSPAKSV